MAANVGTALAVAVVHTLVMTLAGGVLAVCVHRWLGLGVLSRSWFNLGALWSLSLVLVGVIGAGAAFLGA